MTLLGLSNLKVCGVGVRLYSWHGDRLRYFKKVMNSLKSQDTLSLFGIIYGSLSLYAGVRCGSGY
jgi:hypothetical protein